MLVEQRPWGYLKNGGKVALVRLTNAAGAYVEFTNLGATWLSAVVPDSLGRLDDVLLGFNTPEDYIEDTSYMGATVGRFANRIDSARFSIGEETFKLDVNDGKNSNHGGFSGFHKKIWDTELLESGVRFLLTSPDGEGGYPGNLSVEVTYSFSEDNSLSIEFKGRSDRTTVLNMTNHAYLNLAGAGNVLDHTLWIPSLEMLETREDFVPTGRFTKIRNTPFDFSFPETIGKHIHEDDQQLKWNRGYNHCYVLQHKKSVSPVFSARLFHPGSGRQMHLSTTLPGILLYTGNYLDTKSNGKKGEPYRPYDGLCLETQFYPDSPNHAHFPSCLLTSEEEYVHTTVFRFSCI